MECPLQSSLQADCPQLFEAEAPWSAYADGPIDAMAKIAAIANTAVSALHFVFIDVKSASKIIWLC
ncbi:MAG: hypothetical protein KGI25_09845 [Thaumarchaeota archaeon]|nr:hypothetical protein [Nitrososphaerota archaeon]